MMGPPRPTCRPDWGPRALRINDQTTKIASRTNKIEKSSSDSGAESSARTLGFGCQSAVSPLSTLIMPSTPRSMPPEKSLALKRGTIALEMMTDESASVSVPSRP
jgi:hypothetical protein